MSNRRFDEATCCFGHVSLKLKKHYFSGWRKGIRFLLLEGEGGRNFKRKKKIKRVRFFQSQSRRSGIGGRPAAGGAYGGS